MHKPNYALVIGNIYHRNKYCCIHVTQLILHGGPVVLENSTHQMPYTQWTCKYSFNKCYCYSLP